MRSMPQDVRAAFDAFPPEVVDRLAAIRTMIFDLAASDPRIGTITEMLKWGEPAYLTAATGSGSTIRLGWPRRTPGHAAVYFICRTTLVDEFRAKFGGLYRYDGRRAVLIPAPGAVAAAPLEMMLLSALTYHLAKK